MVERDQADVIVVYRWSRLSRKRTDQAVILDRVERAGGGIECATESVDATTAGGKFSREVLLAMAAYEANMRSEQWREAQARRVDNKLLPGGPPPFGYAPPEHRGGPFRPDPVNGPLVCEMYDRYLRGQGAQALARWLNDQGVTTTPRRGKRRGDTEPFGRPFTVSTTQRLLDSGFAAGWLNLDVYDLKDGKRVRRAEHRRERGAHEALIDQSTWEAYVRERDRRRTTHPKSRQPRWHLGGGMTVCGRCGTNVVVDSYISPRSNVICSAYRSSRNCGGVWVQRKTLELIVALWLGGRVQEWADRQDELLGTDEERTALAKELDAAQADQRQLDEGQRTATRLVSLGEITEDDYRATKADVDVARRELDDRIKEMQARLDAFSSDTDVYDRIERGAEGQRPEEWHAVLRRVIKRVVVATDTITIEPWHGEPKIYDRSIVTPHRPPREYEAPRGADGKFVKKAKATRA
jgi:site-specific DNA recombinase